MSSYLNREETTNTLHSGEAGPPKAFDGVESPHNSINRDSVDDSSRSSRVSFESNFNKASIMSCTINLANTILGSGMLGLPYAYSNTGWVLGTFLLLACGMSSGFALHLLSLCALRQPGPASFYSVAMDVMPSMTLVIDAAVAIKCFGVATSYLIVIGDLMPDVMEQLGANSGWQDRHLWVFIGFCIVAPLSCMRNLDSLKFTSFVSVVFVAFLTMLIVLYSADIKSLDPCADRDDDGDCVGNHSDGIVNVGTFQVFAIFVFGYTCQQNIFAVTNELERPSQQRVGSVIGTSIGTAFVIYLIVAACGYSTYGSHVLPDILVNYPRTYLTSVARLFVSMLVAFSYPLQCHPSRRCTLTLISHYDTWAAKRALAQQQQGCGGSAGGAKAMGDAHLDDDINADLTKVPEPPAPELSLSVQRIRFYVVTACFLGLSLMIGLTVTNLGTVLAFVGATGSTTVSYILPGFFYYLTFKEGEGPAWKRRLALCQGIAGLFIMPICLAFIFV